MAKGQIMSKFIHAAGAAMALVLSAGVANAQTPQTAPPAATQGAYTEAQLQAFAAASLEVDPISRSLPSANAEQRTQATVQIREILQRHNIDSQTYNAIAARAQTDPALAQRIAALQTQGHGAHGAPSTQPAPPPG
jgi:hypothetical protein